MPRNSPRNLGVSDQACINAAAAGEKLYDFRSPAIRTGENSMICGVSPNPEVRLTVKFRTDRSANFYRQIYRQKDSLGGN